MHGYLQDGLVVLTLVLLEGLLSADNALVLAVLVRHLPRAKQKRALLYGIGGAYLLRLLALLAVRFVIQLWYLRGLGAAYLLYLSLYHFLRHKSSHSAGAAPRKGLGFWQTVAAVEIMDIAFAMDSVLVAVGLSSKLWVIYLGAVLGILAMRIAAGLLIRVLELYPGLEDAAYLLVGWIGCKLALETWESFAIAVLGHEPGPPLLSGWLFWSVAAAILLLGLRLHRPQERQRPA